MVFFFFSSRRRHTRLTCDWSSDVCSSDLPRDPGRTGEGTPGDSRRAQDLAGRMMAPVAGDLAREVAAAVDELRRVTVQVRGRGAASGAGVLWNGGGSEHERLVITNAHVVRGDRATIELSDGTVARARVVARDLKRDLTALEFEPTGAL